MPILMKHWVMMAIGLVTFFLAQRYYTSDPMTGVAPVSQQAHIVTNIPTQKIEIDVPQRVPAPKVNQQTQQDAPVSVRGMVDQLIAKYPVMVFSKSYCPYSMKAKNALNGYSMASSAYHVLELDKREDGRELQSVLGDLTGASTVPRVFIGGKFIGGGDDIERLHRQGQLKGMLSAAGAL